jgi:hypothetical protein
LKNGGRQKPVNWRGHESIERIRVAALAGDSRAALGYRDSNRAAIKRAIV